VRRATVIWVRACRDGSRGRLLVPLTRGQGDAGLQFDVQLSNLEQVDQVRHRGGSDEDTSDWMRFLTSILRLARLKAKR
jgi:hypothetical protein